MLIKVYSLPENQLHPITLFSQNLIPGELVNGSLGQVVRFRTVAEALQEQTEIAKSEGSGMAVLPDSPAWPVVRFISGREMLCIPHEFTVNNADGGMEAARHQVNSCLNRVNSILPNIHCYRYPLFWLGRLASINLKVKPWSGSR